MLYEDSICKKDDEALERLRTTGKGAEVIAEFKVRVLFYVRSFKNTDHSFAGAARAGIRISFDECMSLFTLSDGRDVKETELNVFPGPDDEA